MSWFKVDDKLHDHYKARRAGKAAMGVWVLAGSWSADNLTDGFIPAYVLARWGTKVDANRLVEAGLWIPETYRQESGWRFRDWQDYQPTATDVKQIRAESAQGGAYGNHLRWHVKRGVVNPECVYCQKGEK